MVSSSEVRTAWPSSKCGAALKRSCLSSAGSTSAATHSSLAYVVPPRQRADGGAGCAQPDDSDLSLSPGLSGSITMVMPMSSSPVLSVLQSHVVFLSQTECRYQQIWNVVHCLLWFAELMFMIAWWITSNCIMWLYFQFLRISINLFVCLVIHDTYTFFTHAAGRIPGKHFNFGLLTFKLCFPSSAFLSAVSSSFQTALFTPFLPLSALISGYI